jgi:hypothetical protein
MDFVYFSSGETFDNVLCLSWFLSLCMETAELGMLFQKIFHTHGRPYILACSRSLLDNNVYPWPEGAWQMLKRHHNVLFFGCCMECQVLVFWRWERDFLFYSRHEQSGLSTFWKFHQMIACFIYLFSWGVFSSQSCPRINISTALYCLQLYSLQLGCISELVQVFTFYFRLWDRKVPLYNSCGCRFDLLFVLLPVELILIRIVSN